MERRLDKSRGVFWGIMGIVEIRSALSAQLKGAKMVVAGIGDSEIGVGIENGMGDSKGLEMVGIGDSVCVDMVTEMGLGVEG